MKVIIACSLAFLVWHFQCAGQSTAGKADKILAMYWSPKKDAKIEIYKRGDKYFGSVKWTANPKKDIKNPDKALQDRNIVGLEFLTNFSYDDGEYTGGKIYDPKSGKTYECKMSIKDQRLQVRGYIGMAMFGRTEVFEMIQ